MNTSTSEKIASSSEVAGFLVVRSADKENNHNCVRWQIDHYESYLSTKQYLKSSVFAIPNASDCKWYLSIQTLRDKIEENVIFCFLRLVMDRESDRKEAFVKFKLFNLGINPYHNCIQRLSTGSTTCNFFSKCVNNTGIMFPIKLYKKQVSILTLSPLYIICEMIIEPDVPEKNSALLKDLKSLFNNRTHTDVVLSVRGKNYPAHKTVLAARSSIFAEMFANKKMEKEGIVYIEDIEGEVVEEMLRFIYTEKVEKLEYLAKDLFIAADKYDLKGLQFMCEEMLVENLSSSNALDVLSLARLCKADELKSKTIDFIQNRGAEVLDNPAWEGFGYSDIGVEILKELCETFLRSKITD